MNKVISAKNTLLQEFLSASYYIVAPLLDIRKGCQYRHSESVGAGTSESEDNLTMITFEQFNKLSSKGKNEEIMKFLPIMIPLEEYISQLKSSMDEALDKIDKLECELGIAAHKTGSVVESKSGKFSSVENINRSSSVTSSNRSRYLSGVSSSNQPLPDISGRK